MVRHSLKAADRVFYAVHDIQKNVETFRPDAEFMPRPIDMNMFTFKTNHDEPLGAFTFKKWYEPILPELPVLMSKYGILFTVFDKRIPYVEMPGLMRDHDVYVDQMSFCEQSKIALEAMSSGLAIIGHTHRNDLEGRIKWLSNVNHVKSEGTKNREYIRENHDANLVADKVAEVWEEVACS
jgi:hypothetical protein